MISKEGFLEGIELCILNAESFINDAKQLEKSKSPRAYTNYQFAIEELGKAYLLFIYSLYGNQGDKRVKSLFLTKIHSHKAKTQISCLIEIFLLALGGYFKKDKIEILTEHPNLTVIKEAILLIDLNKIYAFVEADLINSDTMNLNKNHSLYVSFINESFKDPNKLITETNRKEIAKRAVFRLTVVKSFFQMLIVKNYDQILSGVQSESGGMDLNIISILTNLGR